MSLRSARRASPPSAPSVPPAVHVTPHQAGQPMPINVWRWAVGEVEVRGTAELRVSGDGLAHLFGDYVVQSDWMANEKTKAHAPAVAHALTYAACFLPLTRSVRALSVIAGTHYVIDHWRLARHVVWAKNQAAPAAYRYPWSEGSGTGYHQDRPPWMAVWLMILADNTMHLAINRWALERWSR